MMARGYMPELAEPTVCEKPCQHHDCKEFRELAATPCPRCSELVKEGEAFYLLTPKAPTHARCVEE